MSKHVSTIILIFSVLFCSFIAGCADDPAGPDGPADGTIEIDATPDHLRASWTLTGPENTTFSGSGDTTMTSMARGQYTLAWDAVSGFQKPGNSTLTLENANDTASFNGLYISVIPLNTNPDILMSNLKTIYETMDDNNFATMLHPDFRMVLLQSTIDDWAQSSYPLEENYFDHDSQIQIHQNIFTHLGGTNEMGMLIPPIDSISVTIMEKNGIWEPVEDSTEYFGDFDAYWVQYSILMHFNKPDYSRFEVNQVIDFYVIQGDDETWSLLGIKGWPGYSTNDPTLVTDSVTFGDILSLYR